MPPNATFAPLDHATPDPSAAATTSSAASPMPVRPSQRDAATIRGHTRRSFHTSTSASATPSAACAANTQALSREPANQVDRPVASPSATSSARLQSVPRGVTAAPILRASDGGPPPPPFLGGWGGVYPPSHPGGGSLEPRRRSPVRISFGQLLPAAGR